MKTTADYLVKLLEAWDVDYIFGIPGVHTVELYRGLEHSRLRHITPRHEQGAGFMADGYARVTGKPGVCWIITGPGMTNIVTAMGQAYADSIPMLVISSVNEHDRLGRHNGYLHALKDQAALIDGVCAWTKTVLNVHTLAETVHQAFQLFATERPRPVHIQLPVDLLNQPLPDNIPPIRTSQFYKPAPAPQAIAEISHLLKTAKSPMIFAGGGCVNASTDLQNLVERLQAPTIVSINAKGVLPAHHPLNLGANASWDDIRPHIEASDVILALGTEIGETDYDVMFNRQLKVRGKLIRVDIDPRQLSGEHLPDIGLVADTQLTLQALNNSLGDYKRSSNQSIKLPKQTDLFKDDPEWQVMRRFFDVVLTAIPGARFVGDSTQTVYFGNHIVNLDRTRHWFNSATGYGTLGYGLPAAIGAKLAAPQAPVICLVGDGGLQFSIAELASAVEAKLPIIVLLWNNQGYGEIKRSMLRKQVKPVGVDIFTPNFQLIAQGFGCKTCLVSNWEELTLALKSKLDEVPLLIEIDALSLAGF